MEIKRKRAEVKRKEKLARRKVAEERRMDKLTEIYKLDSFKNLKKRERNGVGDLANENEGMLKYSEMKVERFSLIKAFQVAYGRMKQRGPPSMRPTILR